MHNKIISVLTLFCLLILSGCFSAKGLLWNKLTGAGEVILCNNKAKNADIALATARLFNEVSAQKNESEWASYSLTIPKSKDNSAQNKDVFSQIKQGSNKSDSIQQILAKAVNDGEAPGMIAAIISGDSIIALASAGERKAGSGIKFTINDVVHIGSCGKAMTSTMIATLVADGKLSWDTKLIEAIPELKNKIHTDYHKITLWKLLTHRAGIPKNLKDEGAFSMKEIKDRRLHLVEDNLKSPATNIMGEFLYSNFGYVIAACMAEQITGLCWESLMNQRLFGPLGMSSAGFGNPNKNKTIDQPWGHQKYLFRWHPSEAYYDESIGPAGRVYCSVNDWAKFISLWLTNENPILEREYLDKLIKPVGDHYYAGGWGVAEHDWAKGVTYNHTGSNEIWFASVVVTPKLNRAFVLATNSCDFSSTPNVCLEIANKIIIKELDLNKE